jgi:hypothetical protein
MKTVTIEELNIQVKGLSQEEAKAYVHGLGYQIIRQLSEQSVIKELAQTREVEAVHEISLSYPDKGCMAERQKVSAAQIAGQVGKSLQPPAAVKSNNETVS